MKIPIDSKIPDFIFPEYQKISLNENLTLFVITDKTQLLTDFTVIFPNGAAQDKLAGLTFFSSKMLAKGTRKKTSSQISEAFDLMGATLNINAEWDCTKIGFTCLNQHIDECIQILSDCLFNSTFKKEEFDRLKVKHLADIEQERSDVSYIANIYLKKNIFANHPYGLPLIGNKSSIMSINLNDSLNWYDNLLHSSKINIIITGNFNIKELMDNINKFFIFRNNDYTQKIPNYFKKEIKSKIIIKHKPNEQTILKIGKIAIDRTDEDFPAYQFINTLFGGFFLSRLNNLLREKLGYTYGISSYIDAKKLSSIFIISSGLKKEKTKDALTRIFEQLDLLSHRKIKEEEFLLVRQYLLGSFLRSLETTRQISSLIKNQIIFNLYDNYFNDFYNKIKTLSIDDLFTVQKKYFNTKNIIICAVGDKKLLETQLNDFI